MEKNISRGQLLKIKNDSNYYIYLGQFKSNVDCHLLLKHKKVNDNYVLKCIKTSDIHEINDTQFTDTYYLNNALLDKRIHTQLLHTSAKCAIKFENNKISHLIDIPKGIYGDFSKIKEEFLEFEDSINQDDKVLQICELCDLVGAIGGFVEANFNLTVNDLIKFSDKIKDLKNRIMVIESIKPLIKGHAKVSHIIGGVVWYLVTSEDGKMYQFPVDMNNKEDVGAEATFLGEYEKPIYLMRWIRRANENGSLEEIL